MKHFLMMFRHYLSWYFKHYLRTNGKRERRRKIKIETFSMIPICMENFQIQDPDLGSGSRIQICKIIHPDLHQWFLKDNFSHLSSNND